MRFSHWLNSVRNGLAVSHRFPRHRRRQRSYQAAEFAEPLESRTLLAAAFSQFVDPNPNPGNQFGAEVVPLRTGNVVITSPGDDAGGLNAGAVYLFNGSTGALISTLTGSTDGDRVGNGGVTALSTGNFVVRSFDWDNGAARNAGAVTFGSGITGVSGSVSASNSLVGTRTGDRVGSGGVTELRNGNYVVASSSWDNGATFDAGAVTFGSGVTGIRARFRLQTASSEPETVTWSVTEVSPR